jgi:hypothetical protein
MSGTYAVGASQTENGSAFTKLTNAQFPTGSLVSNAVYGTEPGSGGTGLKFTTYNTKSSSYMQDELVSRKKSIVHSLIFG